MEWLTTLGIKTDGLPWWAAFVLLLIGMLLGKGVQALLKIMGARFEERKYDHANAKEEKDALVKELKDRIEKLEKDRAAIDEKLQHTTAAHAKCEIEQEALRGRIAVQEEKIKLMDFKLSRLWAHDDANQQNVKDLKRYTEELDEKANEAKAAADLANAKIGSQVQH